MGSVSKHQKTNDRISNLPTNLIGSLLSLLPTKDAVRTCALSTHWKQQWTFITRLYFDDSSVKGTSMNDAMFVNFVYRLLLFKVRQLELFRIECRKDYGVKHVNAWIFAALSRNVKQIDLMIRIDDGTHLQTDCLFSSSTLVVLKLGEGFLVRVPNLISLESLKILHFNYVEFEDNESLSRLVSSCPLLEELRIEGELNGNVDSINISSPVLKRLILEGLCFYHPTTHVLLSYTVVLNTRLEYLEHDDFLPIGYHIKTPNCLKRASLCFSPTNEQTDLYIQDPMPVCPMEELAVAISNVRYLRLSCYTLGNFRRHDFSEARLPKFPHLVELEIDRSYSELQLLSLTEFLERTPQLASLSFKLTSRMCEDWHPPINAPFCMRYNLAVIKVDFVGSEMKHLDIVKYFLNHTNCLKELMILRMMKQEAKEIKNVLMFPRASKSCKIVLL